MKNIKLLLTVLIVLFTTITIRAQVGIGNSDPQGALDITSSTEGLLIPRVALTSTATVLPVLTGTASELVYNTNTAGDVTPGFYYLSTPTGPWVRIDVSNPSTMAWEIIGNSNIGATNFMGTTNDVDVAFKRKSLAAGKIGATSTSFGVGALPFGAATNSTAIGNNALSVSTGSDNVAVGQNALQSSGTSASENTAVGVNALKSLNDIASRFNTAVGFQALANATGVFTNCVAVGHDALIKTTKEENTGIGGFAGSNITTGFNNTAIGYNAQVSSATGINQIRIGDGRVTSAGVQVAWTIGSDKRLKSNIKNSELGLDFIKKLRPVSYVRNNDINKKTEYGFIAQELEETLNKAGDKNNGIINIDDAGMYAVRYNDFISITVKAVQEQQAQIEGLQKENTELMKANTAILKRLEALEKKKNISSFESVYPMTKKII